MLRSVTCTKVKDEFPTLQHLLTYHRLYFSFKEYEIYHQPFCNQQGAAKSQKSENDTGRPGEAGRNSSEHGNGIKSTAHQERVGSDMEMIKELGHCSGMNLFEIFPSWCWLVGKRCPLLTF